MIDYETNHVSANARQPKQPPPLPQRSVWLWFVSHVGWTGIGLLALALLTAALAFDLRPTPRPASNFFGSRRSTGPDVGLVLRLAAATVPALILLTALAGIAVAIQRAQARRLMLYVHQAVRLNLPIPDLLAAAEAGEQPGMRARLRKLRRLLGEGFPLGYALERAAPAVARRHVKAVAAAEHLGRLPEALDRIVAAGRGGPGVDADDGVVPSAISLSGSARTQMRWYSVLMLAFLGTTINVFMIFVMPKFEMMMRDYGVRTPGPSRWLTELWAGPGGTIFLLLPIFLLLAYCGRTVSRAVAPSWAAARTGFHLSDRIVLMTPVLRSMVLARGLADAFYVVADALDAGATLTRAIAEASTVPDNVVVRRRLAKWASGVEGGAPAADAARVHRMPELVCGMVASGVGSAQLAGVMRFLARYYGARSNRLAAALEAAAVPALSVVFGAAVYVVALAVFLPLIGMADAIMNQGFE